MCDGGIQHSGSRPSASSSRRCRESVLSVLACRLRPRANAVSAGSATCATTPAPASSSATYRQPVHPSSANATSFAAGEPRQPGPQMHPVGRGDLAALHLPGRGVQIVERELLPVDVEPAYDGHRDLLKLQRGVPAPRANAYAVNRDASELRRSPGERHRPQLSPARCMSSICTRTGPLPRAQPTATGPSQPATPHADILPSLVFPQLRRHPRRYSAKAGRCPDPAHA